MEQLQCLVEAQMGRPVFRVITLQFHGKIGFGQIFEIMQKCLVNKL